MHITNNYIKQSTPTDFTQTIDSAINALAKKINCVRIGIVQEFYPENLTCKVKIASKKVIRLNTDGTQLVRDYAPIFAKVCYCNPFETFPLKKGDEVVLLFNDRELETWFVNGQANAQAYSRMHDLTDCIAIAGIRSLPNMIQILTDALHLFYGASELILKENTATLNSTTTNVTGTDINITGTNVNITGTLTINGQPYLAHTHSNGHEGSPTGGVIEG